MSKEFKKIIEDMLILAKGNAIIPTLENFINDVNNGECECTLEMLNDYIEGEIEEWAYNQ